MKALTRIKTYISPILTRSYWQAVGDYVGIGRYQRVESIVDEATLARFLATRASHVAQTSLYGYLRTRAGTRFPQMFENPQLLTSINIAKWHIWLACVSDLGIFIGQCAHESGHVEVSDIQSLMPSALARVFDEIGKPEEAGPDFVAAQEKIVQRISTYDWSQSRDDDSVFSQSPQALYYWSPIADELKQRDESIVKNSIRFRWIEVRRSLRKLLDSDALAQSVQSAER